MKILLFGGNGQLGRQLRRSLSVLGELTVADRANGGDLLNEDALRDTVLGAKADVVVNAAAYTAVDRAEDEPELAKAVNSTACHVLALATKEAGSWFVQYSTDYVYRGDGTLPWVETDECKPQGVYGQTKLDGDLWASLNPRHIVFRTSWVYDTFGANFLKTIVRAATMRDELDVVSDQWGAPTRAATIADVTAIALHDLMRHPADVLRGGVYHLAAAGETNWNEYARFAIAEAARCGIAVRARDDAVRRISTAQFAARAPRPANSRLDTTKLKRTFRVALPHWQDGVRAVVAELAELQGFATVAKEMT